jgi:urease subunit alpha
VSRRTAAEDRAVNGARRGDRVRLGDTGLTVEVEADARHRGDELLFGFGRTGRDGMALQAVRAAASCDVVITEALVLDPLLGVRVASIGIRDGRIAGVGRAGNPDITDGIDVVVGSGTQVIPGQGLIATAGAIDTHVHGMSPRIFEAALASGVTTILTQELGPMWGVGVGSPAVLRQGYASLDAWPVNVGVLGRGASSRRDPLLEQLEAGVCGFKVHEDTGAHLRTLDAALDAAEEFDVQVCLHTDGLNEGLSVDDTLAVTDGRVVHAFHVEGCGGGHAPDVLRLAGVDHVIGSSTNPTLPYGVNALDEHVAMIVSVHGLNPDVPGDLAIARDRVRAETMGAENLLHDLGVIPITSSDALGMGRAGENWRRTFAVAAVTRGAEGAAPAEPDGHDNERVLRFLAKLTINPALAHGLAHEVGSLAPGRLADVVLWSPAAFAAKPALVIKGGLPAWGRLGDPNATTEVAEPLRYGPQFGGLGGAPAELSVLFTSAAAAEADSDPWPTRRRRVPVAGCRTVRLSAMVRNGRLGQVHVDPASAQVTLDGEPLHLDPVDDVPLQRLYFL